MNILIAEDNTSTQMLIRRLMERWGFKFDIASNGKEAVELAKVNEGEYNLCLMDTDMPIMDGLEAIKMIRRNIKYFPILSLSGDYTNERQASRGLIFWYRYKCLLCSSSRLNELV